MQLPHDPAVAFLVIYLREIKAYVHTQKKQQKSCTQLSMFMLAQNNQDVLQWINS